MNESHNIFSMISPAEYEDVSVLARVVGEAMISRLELVTIQPQLVLDVGCGVGYCSTLLKKQYPDAKLLSIDLAETMLKHMQGLGIDDLVCAEGGRLPLPDHSVDFIFANLLLPWCADWERMFREWRRVLRPEGLLMFSCLGLDTLRELPEHLMILKDMHEVGDALVHAKFSDPVMDVEYLTFDYRDHEKLKKELYLNGMISSDSSMFNEKKLENILSLTIEIIYGHTWGPNQMVNHTADDEGVVKIPLSFLRNRGSKSRPTE